MARAAAVLLGLCATEAVDSKGMKLPAAVDVARKMNAAMQKNPTAIQKQWKQKLAQIGNATRKILRRGQAKGDGCCPVMGDCSLVNLPDCPTDVDSLSCEAITNWVTGMMNSEEVTQIVVTNMCIYNPETCAKPFFDNPMVKAAVSDLPPEVAATINFDGMCQPIIDGAGNVPGAGTEKTPAPDTPVPEAPPSTPAPEATPPTGPEVSVQVTTTGSPAAAARYFPLTLAAAAIAAVTL